MKYEKPVVKKIIYNNEDILAVSFHKCELGDSGSNQCLDVGRVCDWGQHTGICDILVLTNRCTKTIGYNSTNPTESF